VHKAYRNAKLSNTIQDHGENKLLTKSAIVLAGGFSSRFGRDKGLVELGKKPLIRRVLETISPMVEERIVVVSSKAHAENYVKVLGSGVNVLVDIMELHSPLVGALTGFKGTRGDYAILLSTDTPFLSRDVISLLFDLCTGKSAVIPRWPNGYMEPLVAVYCAEPAAKASEDALTEGKLRMQCMVDKLRGVRYVSTMVLQQLDPELRTFFNVNTPLDLKKAEHMLKRKA
jgi:molybdopterin-guanine dinucleotide biosynthesis protein A